MSRNIVFLWDFHKNFLLACIVFVSLTIGFCIGATYYAPPPHPFLGQDTRDSAYFAQFDYITLGFVPGSKDIVFYSLRQGNSAHNQNGAGMAVIDPVSGVCILEVYYINGEKHRSDGPAVITRNKYSGIVEQAEWWRSDKPYYPSADEVRKWKDSEIENKSCEPVESI